MPLKLPFALNINLLPPPHLDALVISTSSAVDQTWQASGASSSKAVGAAEAGVGDGVNSVGAGVGISVGLGVGDSVGSAVGDGVGLGVGDGVGFSVGSAVGDGVGLGVGDAVGYAVGDGVGYAVGDGVA